MQSMEGIVTIVQEGRFQLLDGGGVSHHVLAFPHGAALSQSSFRPCSMSRLACAWSTRPLMA